jgi:ATP-binding cassette subfamily F protein uup
MASPPLLLLQDTHLTLGTSPVLDGASLGVGLGDRLALVGRNGSGKSTLLKIAAGTLAADSGSRFVQPGATVRYLPQEPDLTGYDSVLAYVEAGLGPSDDPYRARYLLEQLGLHGDEAPAVLSGGEARRAALARVLAPSPDVLLLDEPTNHLDLPAIEWLQSELASLRSGLVLISHDRRLLSDLSRAMVWLDRGTTRRVERGFAQFEAWRDETLEQEERDRHKLGRKIAAEEDWLRYGVTARRKRNVKRLADLHMLRQTRREQVRAAGSVRLAAANAALSGKQVIVASGVGLDFGARTIVGELDALILRGDRVGIVGPNGAGKTTLLQLLTGTRPPDRGTVTLGSELTMVTLDQRRESLDPTLTLSQTLTGGAGDTVEVHGQKRHVIGYMKDFLFAPEQARTPVGVLSGGERGRLLLALALAKQANLLVLDEPTNDLDLETLELLQEMLAEYPGTVLVVSHDRDFLDRVATSVIAYEGEGNWQSYAGGYSDMVAQRGAGVAARIAERAAAEPAERAKPSRGCKSAKLTFNDQHLLRTLPKRIDDLAAEAETARAALADPGLYARDPTRFTQLTALLARCEAELNKAEETWLTVELRREELETGT